jgi:SSS family solute:Na+ symporter
MHIIDLTVFVVYSIGMAGVGLYFYKKNETDDDYFLGGRTMKASHVGLSVVATDVGGGFSIGLGGLGFVMGIAGSWMLFTGLIGAWLAAVFLIPRLYEMPQIKEFHSFPQVLGAFYNPKVAVVAGIISAIGYIGFSASQILAGAKLASVTIDGLSLKPAVIILGLIAVGYTVLGGMKAVIYTDTFQWSILIIGLAIIGLPLAYFTVGGWESIQASVAPEMLSMTNVSGITILNWAITIIPIWFIGMTLYQRIFACGNEKEAKKAWFIAGLLEWPIMAFMGVGLGLLARVAVDQGLLAGYSGIADVQDPEVGLPLLIKTIYPIGLTGVMLAAYFSAILSTADSCLMAASGNIVTDLGQFFGIKSEKDRGKSTIKSSQIATLVIGVFAILLAWQMEEVLSLMLYSYAFMVSGLFIPILMALFTKNPSSKGALVAMILGGSITLSLQLFSSSLPFGLDANIFGISAALISYVLIKALSQNNDNALTA